MSITKRLYLLYVLVLLNIVGCIEKQYQLNSLSTTYYSLHVDSAHSKTDSNLDSVVAPYKNQLDEKMNEIIGSAHKELVKQEVESTLGNFIADLLKKEGEKIYEGKIDMGVTTIGGLRVPIPKGDISVGDIYELMPFENMVSVCTLTGKEINEMFEYMAKRRNIAISNTKVIIQGNAIEKATLNGESIDIDKEYTICLSDYLANGGDQMNFMDGAKTCKKLNISFRDIIIQHIRNLSRDNQAVNADIEDRVVIKN